MTVLNILTYPDERLRTKAQPVKDSEFNTSLQTIIDDMIETMYAEEGIGLAATQVDIHQRIIVIDISESRDAPFVLINPEIIEMGGEDSIEEGCLSVPQYRAHVPRAAAITVKAQDRNGEEFTLEAADELLAICLQHELDHLDGKLFVDRLSPLKRDRLKKKLAKQKKNEQ